MILIAASAAFVGLVHSLAPGHWLPVVLMSKGRRWPLRKAAVGALAAASGHILLSIALGIVGAGIEAHYLVEHEELIESWSGLALAVFGLIYAAYAFFRHHRCHGHTHHGPEPDEHGARSGGAILFLFSIGLSPCVAALSLFAAAAPLGPMSVALTMAAFAAGVITALVGATLLASAGLLKLDHPILEHYGDVITGTGVLILGLILFLQ